MIFVRKEKRNNDFIQPFLLFCVSLRRAFTRAPRHMRVVLLMQEPANYPFKTETYSTQFERSHILLYKIIFKCKKNLQILNVAGNRSSGDLLPSEFGYSPLFTFLDKEHIRLFSLTYSM